MCSTVFTECGNCLVIACSRAPTPSVYLPDILALSTTKLHLKQPLYYNTPLNKISAAPLKPPHHLPAPTPTPIDRRSPSLFLPSTTSATDATTGGTMPPTTALPVQNQSLQQDGAYTVSKPATVIGKLFT